MPMPQDGGGFGRALATVLRERPCRVIVESLRADARGRRGGVARGRREDGSGRATPGGTPASVAIDRAFGDVVVAVAAWPPAWSRRCSRVTPAAGLGSLYLLAVLAVAIRRGEVAGAGHRGAQRADAELLLHHAAPPADDRPLPGRGRADRAADRGGRGRAAGGAGPRSGRPRPRAAPGWPPRASARPSCWPRSPRRSSPATASSAQLESIGGRIADGHRRRARASRARAGAVARSPDEVACRCDARAAQRLAVPVGATAPGSRAEIERVAEPLGRLIDVAVERERRRRARRRDRGGAAGPRWPRPRSCTRSRTTCARR